MKNDLWRQGMCRGLLKYDRLNQSQEIEAWREDVRARKRAERMWAVLGSLVFILWIAALVWFLLTR